jgi:type IV secretion system protein VirB9
MKTRIHFLALAISACLVSAFAQSPAAPPNLPAGPVPAKRVRGMQTLTQKQSKEPDLLQKYDFGGQLQVLQDPTGMDPRKRRDPAAAVTTHSARDEGNGKAPKGFQPPTDVPLTSTALDAIRVSESWRVAHNTPAAGADGRVLYAYGAGLPIIVCAPLRVCMIELQPGERINRWVIRSAGMCHRQCTDRAKTARQ